MSREIGIPDIVLTLARAYGAHNDCLVAGPDGCCPNCSRVVTVALTETYGHLLSSSDVMLAVLTDLDAEPKR